VSSSLCVASLVTTDLQAELERPRSGEDGCITIKRQRKRRRCQGRNLDRDFDAVDTTPVGQAALTPTSPLGSGGGCMTLAPHFRMVVWPCKFWLHLLKKYDGSVNPAEFLQIYSTTIIAAGGNDAIMTNYFSVALTGMARSWLTNLPEGESNQQIFTGYSCSSSGESVINHFDKPLRHKARTRDDKKLSFWFLGNASARLLRVVRLRFVLPRGCS
jgi:hypothetical protein